MLKNALNMVLIAVLLMLLSFAGCAKKDGEKNIHDHSDTASVMTDHMEKENQSEQSSEINPESYLEEESLEAQADKELSVAEIDKEETYPEVPGELDITYTDVSQIISDAGYIAQVSIVEQSVEMLDGLPQTHTMVKVISVFKGDLNADDTIEIVEEGGMDGMVMGGIPQLSDKSDYLLFLKKYKDKYYICGAFQGRFIIRNGYVFQQATEDVKLSSYSPAVLGDFKDMLSAEISRQEAVEQ